MELGLDQKSIRKYKPYAVPVISLLVVLLLSSVLYSFFSGRIGSIQTQLNKARNDERAMEERLNVLESVQVEVEESADIVSVALPQSNPTVFIINNILSTVRELNIGIDNLDTSLASTEVFSEEINTVQLRFELSGEYQQIQEFISRMKKASPLMNLVQLVLEAENDGSNSADITYYSFYAPLPETIPSITSSLNELSDSEKSTISALKEYELPTIVTNPQNSIQVGKVNPFEVQTN